MAKHAVIVTDNMSGTQVGKDIISAKYYVGETETAIDNGNVVTTDGFIDREIRKAIAPSTDTALENLYVIASPEVIKDKKYYALDEYTNEAGMAIVLMRLTHGSVFSVTAEALDGEMGVGKYVNAQAGTKMKVEAAAGTTGTNIGKIVRVEGEYAVIEVA